MADHRIAPDQVIPTLERRILVDGFHVVLDLTRSVRFRPALTIEPQEIDEGFERVDGALRRIANKSPMVRSAD